MKRIFTILCLALVIGACDKNKDKENAPFKINPYNLVGVWACTEHIALDGQNSPYVAEHTALIISINSITYQAPYFGGGTWEAGIQVEGDKIQASDDDGNKMLFEVKSLDGKHMTWHQYPDENETEYAKESFINVTRILPGKWKIQYPDGYTIATIDAKGSFVEEYETPEPFSMECEWLLDISNGQVILHIDEIAKDYVLWSTKFTLLKITDDRIEAKQSGTNADIVLLRQ